ncbi:MAG: sulfite exporter TauE/SafE family protein [Leptospirales bacterium]|nr:sulfite exporter TauE/SafE family protein [Leptospirales bacterium]
MSAMLGLALLQGVVGSVHCAAMCGPFACALSAGQRSLTVQLLYNLGRSLSYMTAGMLLGWLGVGADAFLFRDAAAWIGALLMIYFGLATIFPALQWKTPISSWIYAPMRMAGRLLGSRAARSENALLLGIVSGLLPCGLLYSAYGLSLAQGHPLGSAMVMFAFSLGAYPVLLAIGLLSGEAGRLLQGRPARAALGLLMLLAGFWIIIMRYQGQMHHSHEMAPEQSAAEAPAGVLR